MQHNTLAVLEHDHALLRKKLALIKTALQVAPESRFVLREMCFSLQRLLNDHTLREFHLLYTGCREDLWQVANHASVLTLLRDVSELFAQGWRASMPVAVIRVAQAIEQLETQMSEQERVVFSQVAEAAMEEVPYPEHAISSHMSVNEILQRYPQAQQCFDELHINRAHEGYDSVDELAWRHGFDASQLLEQLRHIMMSSPTPS